MDLFRGKPENKKHTYTIAGSGIGYKGGNYVSAFPLPAAKKAGRQLFLKLNKPEFSKYKKKTTIKFILRQRIRGAPGKTFAYEVTRHKLKTPKIFKKGNTEIKIEYEYNVKVINIDQKEAMRMTGGKCSFSGGGDVEGSEGGEDVSEGGEGDVEEGGGDNVSEGGDDVSEGGEGDVEKGGGDFEGGEEGEGGNMEGGKKGKKKPVAKKVPAKKAPVKKAPAKKAPAKKAKK